MGKASYAITIFPYVTLTILLIYGLTLPGASDGVDFYLSADWSRLGDTAIWTQACIQITMSLGIGLGMHMALATYNDSDEKILIDASAVATLNSATSIYAGLAVFAMMGFLAGESGSPIESVGFTTSGEKLCLSTLLIYFPGCKPRFKFGFCNLSRGNAWNGSGSTLELLIFLHVLFAVSWQSCRW